MGLTAESLLSRYPNLAAEELKTLIDLFPRLSYLDIALMSADERLAEKVSAFHQAHENQLKTPRAALIGFLIAFGLIPVAMVAGLVWWVM
jgi:hypothetical protein